MVAAPPPSSAESDRLARYLTTALFLGPVFILLGVWMVYPAVYTIIRSFFGQHGFLGTWVGIDNYKTLFTHVVADDGDQEQRHLGRRRPGARHLDRAHLRRAHGARSLGGRVQDRRLPADGDLRVCDRRDLAAHVPAGPEHRRDQRAQQVGPRRLQPRRRALLGVTLDSRAAGDVIGRVDHEDACASGRHRLARSHGDRSRPGAEERGAGGATGSETGRHRRHRLARLQTRRRQARRRREGRARVARGDRRAARCGREDGSIGEDEDGRNLRLLQGPGRARTTQRSARRRSRSRSAASVGSVRS